MRYGSYDVNKPRLLKTDWVSFFVGVIVVLLVTVVIYFANRKPATIISPCPDTGCAVIPTPTNTPKPEADSPHDAPQRPFMGIASYYSLDGCIGCSASRTMSNGEVLDDTKYTLAHNQIPLNTMVEVVNTRNGKKAVAKVTDRGGFNRYGRIADLSLALAKAIDLKTDVDILTITPVNGD